MGFKILQDSSLTKENNFINKISYCRILKMGKKLELGCKI